MSTRRFERQLATPEHLARDRAHQMAKLANTVLVGPQPDPERAADLGLACVPAARDSGSARIGNELRDLDRALTTSWPDLPGTGALHEALTA